MPFAICGLSEVKLYKNTPLNYIFSFGDYKDPVPETKDFAGSPKLYRFCFSDLTNSNEYSSPQKFHVRDLIYLFKDTSLDHNILFHCYAGVSRSSAAAFLWLVHHRVDYGQAYDMVVKVRGPFVCPNSLIVKLGDEVMDKKGEMHDFIKLELGRRAEERDNWYKNYEIH